MSIPLKIINNTSFKDKRGFYWTTWKKGIFKKIRFNHDKFSISKKNTIRGLHCDFKSWKLVTCVFGKLLLVVVDMRKSSKNYLKSKELMFPLLIFTIFPLNNFNDLSFSLFISNPFSA